MGWWWLSKELSSTVVMHEYPLSIVEYVGFSGHSMALNSSLRWYQRTLSRMIYLKCLNMKMQNNEIAGKCQKQSGYHYGYVDFSKPNA